MNPYPNTARSMHTYTCNSYQLHIKVKSERMY